MSNATETIIFECPRIQSIGVNNINEDYNNKSKWTNEVPPTLLRRGDQLNLQQVLVNVAGADSNAISFEGTQTTPNNPVLDNYSLLNIGFYINHAGIQTLGLPFKYIPDGDTEYTGTMLFDTDKKNGDDTNYEYMTAEDYNYMFDAIDITDPAPSVANTPREFKSVNINQVIDSTRYAKIDPSYTGWARTGGNKRTDLAQLMNETITLDIDVGFTAPQALADTITLTLGRTVDPSADDDGETFVPKAYVNQMRGNPTLGGTNAVQQHFNGSCLKTITANIQRQSSDQHHIYHNIAVNKPYKWLYGSRILSSTDTDNLKTNRYLPDDKVDCPYPCFIWNRFIGDDGDTFDLDTQYSIYSPFTSQISSRSGGNLYLLKIEGFSSTLTDFNDVYINQMEETALKGGCVVKTGNNFTIVMSDQMLFQDETPADFSPMLYVDDDHVSTDNIVAYNRFWNLGGSWNADEHEIFLAPGLGGQAQYQYSGTQATPADFFNFIADKPYDIVMGSPTSGLGNTGYQYIYDMIKAEAGGIVEGGEYTIKFTLSMTTGDISDTEVELSTNAGIGLPTTTYTSLGEKTLSFTASASSTNPEAIRLGFDYKDIGVEILVDSFSIVREDFSQDDAYTVVDMWSGNYTTLNDNKMYTLQKVNGNTNIQSVLSGNTSPTQTPTYTGVDLNRTYNVLRKGVVLRFLSGFWRATTTLNGHDSDVALLVNDSDPDYTYWMYQDYNDSTNWYVERLSKYEGGIPEDNDIIGTAQSNRALIKNKFRAGQQYYDFEAESWTAPTAGTIYQLASGNTWDSQSPAESYTFVDTTGTRPNGFTYDHTYQRIAPTTGATVFLATTATNGLSGTAQYDTGSSAIWTGTWTLTTTGGANGFGQLTLTASWGSENFDAGATLTSTSGTGSVSLTNYFTANTLPSLPNALPVIDGLSYAYDTTINGVQYFLGMNTAGTDEDLEGKRGTVKFSTDGGTSYNTTTWNWDGSTTLDIDGDGGNIPLTAGGTASLTDVVQYPTSQSINSHNIPTDGKQYGDSQQDKGSTTSTQPTSPVYYLGGMVDGWATTYYPNNGGYVGGFVYDNEADTLVGGGNGTSWRLEPAPDGGYAIQIYDNASTRIDLYLKIATENIMPFGWVLFTSDTQTNFTTTGNLLSNATNTHWITRDSQTSSNLKAIKTLDSGTQGIAYNIYEGATISGEIDSCIISAQPNGNIQTTKANLPKNQLLMTNLKFSMANLELIKEWFRGTEIYEGTQEERSKIIADKKGFNCEVDIGWSDDTRFNFVDGADLDLYNGQPAVPAWMKETGKMGDDDSNTGGSNMNDGCVYPRMKDSDFGGSTDVEQRIKVFTAWGDDYNNRIVADGLLGETYNYGKRLELSLLKSNYKEQYDYCVKFNVGVIPYINTSGVDGADGAIMCGFEVFQDYTDGELYKIQNGTPFGFSPMFFDSKYVVPMNPFMTGQGSTYTFSSDINDYTNALNIGSTNPTLNYNTNLNKFEFKYLHTPVRFNLAHDDGTTSNLGEEIARLWDDAEVVFEDYLTNPLQDKSSRNVGVNDSQAGIYLNDVYLNYVGSERATEITDDTAVILTPSNFYNTMWWKMGFTYFDIKPLSFNTDSFNNRFFNLYYNNTKSQFRKFSQRPLTTNSFLSISDATASALMTANGGGSDKQANAGTPLYHLNYNGNQTVAIEVSSASMTAKSIPVNIGSGYYRIHVANLPIDTLKYSSGGSSVNCVGYALLNYASSNQFFFSYAMDFGATITKDTVVSQIAVEIRNDRGQLVRGLGDRSSIVFKVVRSLELDPPQPDPEEQQLEQINSELQELNQKTELQNTYSELEDIRDENKEGGIENEASELVNSSQLVSKGKGGGRDPRDFRIIPPTQGKMVQQTNEFIRNLYATLIQTLVSRTVIVPSDINDRKKLVRKLSDGIANYFSRNNRKLDNIVKRIYRDGLEKSMGDPELRNLIGGLKGFMINRSGELIDDTTSRPTNVRTIQISSEGAEAIINEIQKVVGDGISADKNPLEVSNRLEPLITTLAETDEIVEMPYVPNISSTGTAKTKDENQGYTREQRVLIQRNLSLDLESFLKVFLRLDKSEIDLLDIQQLRNFKNEMNQAFEKGEFKEFRALIEGMRSEIQDTLGDDPAMKKVDSQLQELRGDDNIVRKKTPAKVYQTGKEKEEAKEMRKEERRQGITSRKMYYKDSEGTERLLTEKQREAMERRAMGGEQYGSMVISRRKGKPLSAKMKERFRKNVGDEEGPVRKYGRMILEKRRLSGRGTEGFKKDLRPTGGGGSK